MITVSRTEDVVAIAMDLHTAKILELVCGRDATVSKALDAIVRFETDITQPELKQVLGDIYRTLHNA